MNGNRGAKGSIKDRVISMLYRYRYKSKKKESDYTVNKKEKQKEYIDNLINYKEKQDINILDTYDKNKLDDKVISVKVNKEYFEDTNRRQKSLVKEDVKTNKKEKSEEQVIIVKKRPKGISVIKPDIKISSEKVDLKLEKKKVKEEITILKEVNNFIKKSKENLEEIKNEVSSIKVDLKNQNQDITKLEERYNKLKIKIEKLKIQYDTIKDKYDLSEFKILESIKLITSIDNYKSIANLNEIETMVNVCKKEISSISSISIINENKKQVNNTINNINDTQKNIKIKFNKSKSDIKDIDSMEELIKKELMNQESIVNEMYSKASYLNKETYKTTMYVGKGKLLSSVFKIALGMLTIPLSKRKIMGYAVGATLINKGLKDLNNNYEKKEKIVVNVKYEDISNKLSEITDILDYTNKVLDNSLSEIGKLKYNFKNEYSKYSNVLPNYDESLNKLDLLEVSIKNNQKKVKSLYKSVDNEKELNNKKMQKVKEIKSRY